MKQQFRRLIKYMRSKILILMLLASVLLVPTTVSARFFNADDIFTDKELFDSNALSRTAIQRFLEAKNSVLATTSSVVAGVPKLVSEMVYEIGKQYGISQKFLLTKLQQEQGLIEKNTASQKKLDWATGYSCFSNRCNDKYRGIYNQLDAAADTQRIYAEKGKSSGYFGFELGKESKTKDGKLVTPKNQATTNLYIYTPYQGSDRGIGGNYFFWRVWSQYFTERKYTDGTLLKNKNTGTYWVIEENKRRKFVVPEIYLKDHEDSDAVLVDHELLSYYEIGSPIEFSNNTLVKDEKSNLMYLLSDGYKHRLIGSKALASLGYHLADTEPVTPITLINGQLDPYPEGEPITENSEYPYGILVTEGSGAIFLLKNGIKQPILDEAVWQENYNKEVPVEVSSSVLNTYVLGDPVKLKDGSIVKSKEGKFYIVSNGEKHKITSLDIIRRVYGQNVANNIPQVSDATLALLDDSDRIDYIDDTIQDPSNYVSYAQKQGLGVPSAPASSNPTYLTLFDTVDVPENIIAGAPTTITVKFRNRGTAPWNAGKVYLKLIDENSSTSSFLKNNRVPLSVNVAANQIAEFTFSITAPLTGGVVKEWFIMEYEDASGAILEMRGGLVAKEISVVSGISAQVLEHNLPVAVRNKWTPIDIAMKIKNTSTEQIWVARRAALKLMDEDGEESPFYDSRDWIDKEVVGVPLNKSKIAPGEDGVLKFTIDPRGVKAGTYKLIFSMELRDIEEQVYLNGRSTWERSIRVDN
jgi:hypothetical protein